MEPKDKCQNTKKILDERWNAKMDALEAFWRTKIGDAQAEYKEEPARLKEKPLGVSSPSAPRSI